MNTTREKGEAVIQTLGLLFVVLMVGGLAVDSGVYFNLNQGMRNSADAAALAGATELFLNKSLDLSDRFAAARNSAKTYSELNMDNKMRDQDIEFGYVDPITVEYNPSGFTSPTNNPAFAATGGYNAIRVKVKAGRNECNDSLPTLFTRLMGVNSLDSQSHSVALYGGGIASFSGLRPVYMCRTGWDKAVELYGDPTIPEMTFYGDTLKVGNTTINQSLTCGRMGPGNWGLADLANGQGAPGADTVREWFKNGYTGQVFTGRNYESQTGTPLNSFDDELNQLKDAQTVINIPLYDATSGNGSNEVFHVAQIASFVITDFKTTGSQSQRYIKGYFKKSICHSNCTLGTSILGGGTTKLRLVY